jgi:hypothetical protein
VRKVVTPARWGAGHQGREHHRDDTGTQTLDSQRLLELEGLGLRIDP